MQGERRLLLYVETPHGASLQRQGDEFPCIQFLPSVTFVRFTDWYRASIFPTHEMAARMGGLFFV